MLGSESKNQLSMILQTFNSEVRPLVSDLSESERKAWFLDPTGNISI